jgi:metallo-beta-lactamase class B
MGGAPWALDRERENMTDETSSNRAGSGVARLLGIALLLAGIASVHAQPAGLPENFTWPEGWTKPFPAHRVIGPLYAVGTYDLGVFLITSEDGHILINTGLEDSTALIRDNVESLGFKLEDVAILLSMQSHFDHTAALAEIKELSGAEMWATAKDAPILEDGGFSDPHFGGRETFPPIEVDRRLSDGDVIELGGIRLKAHDHPGHTEGSSSYSMTVTENGRAYAVVIANMGTINPGKRLVVDPTYPGAGDDFAKTFGRQKAMKVDVWVAAHGSQYGLHDKYAPGQPYDANTFVDPEGFLAAVARLEAIYLDQVAAEQAAVGVAEGG